MKAKSSNLIIVLNVSFAFFVIKLRKHAFIFEILEILTETDGKMEVL